MEFRLTDLKEKIENIRPFKSQLVGEELEFFESCDFLVSRTDSYWEIGHVQFGLFEYRIDEIKEKINIGKV